MKCLTQVLAAALCLTSGSSLASEGEDLGQVWYNCGLAYFNGNVVDEVTQGRPETYQVPRLVGTVRIATFNGSLNRNAPGELIEDLSTPDNRQAQRIAEIIQRANPDVLLINEFDFDAQGTAAWLFQKNYLSVSQNGAPPIDFPHLFLAPSNTGVPANTADDLCCDFNNNGIFGVLNDDGFLTDPNDGYGFGNFPGQYGMLLLSRYPIKQRQARTFQLFLWKDMPDALLPDDPATPAPDDWYSPEELEVLRLSSKSHWDVPVTIHGETLHVLASHPTPPAFDDNEADRNKLRNHDEIRLWADYVGSEEDSRYLVDDQGERGGFKGKDFVIMGDQNADPFDGNSIDQAIAQLLDHPAINSSLIQSSLGGPDAAVRDGGANAFHLGNPVADTADFSDGSVGNLRVDYVLPSQTLNARCGGVFWPAEGEAFFDLVGVYPDLSSDHRLVWLDVQVEDEDERERPCDRGRGCDNGDED
jgi:3-phytase